MCELCGSTESWICNAIVMPKPLFHTQWARSEQLLDLDDMSCILLA
jgi:hypothetical protein